MSGGDDGHCVDGSSGGDAGTDTLGRFNTNPIRIISLNGAPVTEQSHEFVFARDEAPKLLAISLKRSVG